MQDLIGDTPSVQSINCSPPGVQAWQGFKYYDYFFCWPDEWRVKPNFTLNNNNPVSKMDFPPARDNNNWAPRIGFNRGVPKFDRRIVFTLRYAF